MTRNNVILAVVLTIIMFSLVVGSQVDVGGPIDIGKILGVAVSATNGLPVYPQTAATFTVTGAGGTFPVTGTFWQATQPVSGTFWQATQPVSGTFWQATQPISAAALPLPTGASTEATLTAINGKITAVNTGAVVVSSSALPAGAATSALQGAGLPAALAGDGGLKVTAATADAAVDAAVTTNPVQTGGIHETTPTVIETGDVAANHYDVNQNLYAALMPTINAGLMAPYSYISDATDLVSVTDGPTTLYGISCTSTDATVIYIKFYNKASAPDPSGETPVLRFAVPSAATGGGFVWNVPQGIYFATGLGFALMTGAADADETAVTANEVMVNLIYKH